MSAPRRGPPPAVRPRRDSEALAPPRGRLGTVNEGNGPDSAGAESATGPSDLAVRPERPNPSAAAAVPSERDGPVANGVTSSSQRRPSRPTRRPPPLPTASDPSQATAVAAAAPSGGANTRPVPGVAGSPKPAPRVSPRVSRRQTSALLLNPRSTPSHSLPGSPRPSADMGLVFGEESPAKPVAAPRRQSFHGLTASNRGAEVMRQPGASFFVKPTSKFKGKRKRFITIDAVNREVLVFDSASEDGKLLDPTATLKSKISIDTISAADLESSSKSIILTFTENSQKAPSKITMEAVDAGDGLMWYRTLRQELPPGSVGAFRWRKAADDGAGEAVIEDVVPRAKVEEAPTPIQRSRSRIEDSEARLLARVSGYLAESCRYCPITVEEVKAKLEPEFGDVFVNRMVNEIRGVLAGAEVPAPPDEGASAAGVGGPGVAALRSDPLRVLVASMNVGNAALSPDQLQHWLKGGQGAEVVAVGLQESVSYHGYEKPEEPDSGKPDGADGNKIDDAESGKVDSVDDADSDSSDGEGDEDDRTGSKWKGSKESGKASLKAAIREKLMLDGDNVLDALLEHLNKESPEGPRQAGSPTGYKLAASLMRGEMRLLIFTRSTPRFPIHSIETSAVNTGLKILGQRQPNKGGIVIKLVLGMTTLCFVSCHLAAHEGPQYYAARNSSITEILRGANVGNLDCDLTEQFHHMFFFGDLNYRVDFATTPKGGHTDPTINAIVLPAPPTVESGKKKLAKKQQKELEMAHKRQVHAVRFSAAYKILAEGVSGLRRLYVYDELQRALNQDGVLCGFNTARPHFAPTFKVTKKDERKTDEKGLMAYNLKRIPSWCDRILWKSLPGHKHRLSLVEHTSCEEVTTSDHKPMSALFSLTPAPLVAPKKDVEPENLPKISLSEITATLFCETRETQAEHDFVLAVAVDPDGLVQYWSNVAELAASVGESGGREGEGDGGGTTRLTWVQNFLLGFKCTDIRDIHTILNLRDNAKPESDRLYASAAIPLGALYSAKFGKPCDIAKEANGTLAETAINVPLVRAGQQVGHISVKVILNPEADVNGFASYAQNLAVGSGAQSIC